MQGSQRSPQLLSIPNYGQSRCWAEASCPKRLKEICQFNVKRSRGIMYSCGLRRPSKSYRVASRDGPSWSPCFATVGHRQFPAPSTHSTPRQSGRVSSAYRQFQKSTTLTVEGVKESHVHLEEHILVFLTSRGLDLLGELDYGLKMGIVLLLLYKQIMLE